VVDAAVAMLPETDAAGYSEGDDKDLVERSCVVERRQRGLSTLARKLGDPSIGFMVSARSNPAIEAAVGLILGERSRWHSVGGNRRRRRRDRTQVADITDLMDMLGWPAGTRVIVRR